MVSGDIEYNIDDILSEVKSDDFTSAAPTEKPPQEKSHRDKPAVSHELNAESRKRSRKSSKAPSSKTQIIMVLLYTVLLTWGLFNVHPDASPALALPEQTAPEATDEPEEEPVASPPSSESITPTPAPTAEPAPHYSIPDGSVVAPKANPACFGNVAVENAAELLPVIQQARDAGLLGEDEIVVFDENVQFNTGSYYKDIVYYYDETILAIGWKELVDGNTVTCMEVKVADASQFRRKLSGDAYGSPTDYLSNLYKSTNAVLAMNADYYQFREYGVMAYDGTLYKAADKRYLIHNDIDYHWYNCLDNCYVTRSGDFLFTYFGQAFTWDELQQFIYDNDIAFSLSFGPVLVDDYELQTHYEGWYPVGEVCDQYSRAGIGQVDERHYLYMSLNHSDEKSARWTMLEFGRFFQSKNVKNAYAFDGGQTSEVIFNGDIYAHIDRGTERWVSDMIYFATALPEEVWHNG